MIHDRNTLSWCTLVFECCLAGHHFTALSWKETAPQRKGQFPNEPIPTVQWKDSLHLIISVLISNLVSSERVSYLLRQNQQELDNFSKIMIDANYKLIANIWNVKVLFLTSMFSSQIRIYK